MCAPCHRDSEIPDWIWSFQAFAWRHRESIRPAAAAAVVLVALAGLLVYLLSPSDMERAEADIKKAWVVVQDLEDESDQQGKDARGHSQRAAEYRDAGNETKAATDETYLEWCDSSAHAHRQLAKAKRARRDNTLHLAAEYRRLLSEAECEILRAKDARDRGTPYKVAPRVRDILAPVLGSH